MKATPSNPRPHPIEAGVRQSLDQALGEPCAGDAAVIGRVRLRVMDAVARRSSLLHRTVRADAGVWEPLAPGVERKLLWQTADAVSCLVRLAPGSTFPSHNHPIDEESVVLEGSLRIGSDLLLLPGDFHLGRKGVEHETVSTQDGCLCFLRTARCLVVAAA